MVEQGQLAVPEPTAPEQRPFPSLYRASRAQYRICDPAGGAEFTRHGTASLPRLNRWSTRLYVGYAVLGALLLTGLSLLVWPTGISAGAVAGALIVGSLGGVALSAIPTALTTSRIAHRVTKERTPEALSVPRGDGETQAWTLCDLAFQLGNSPSWRDGTIDPSRRTPAIVWGAVQRVRELDQKVADAQRAQSHGTLRGIADQAMRDVERGRATIDQVEANLREVLATARSIDQRRAEQRARTLALEEQRREENELRNRLAAPGAAPAWAGADEQLDRSEGLAAETAAMSELLADSDRILHDDAG